ncbi:hypothetical protein LTR97_005003 [Elasticomyces elasticus]|uniref:Rho termination factor N-terminal domain-containing protein n=1 Tax=Elasticomyces elasticus TaxID=574655 RepID=A0AAN7ZU57_9PEZI|nr:hypothetical protein LTR97_005003 [Elasticomyces elasticus]
MSSWLQRQRKQALIDLSQEAGLRQGDELRKDEIVEALESHLRTHATRLSRNPSFQPYYGTSPYKTTRSSSTMGGLASDDGEVKSVVRGRGRRSTAVKQEPSEDTGASSPAGPSTSALTLREHASTSLTRRTPGRPRSDTRPRLPASPADVADLAEYETTQFYAGLNDFYTISGIPETLERVREVCSSVIGVQMAFQLLEASGLQRAILPWIYLMDVKIGPGIQGMILPVYYPDLFKLLTADFWLPTLLYATTSIFVPALFAYFFNLTTRNVNRHGATVSVARYTVDPLMFNVVKAILTYVVYGQLVGANIFGVENVATVRNSMIGGHHGVLVGCYVCILASVYEAAQRKP